jgi:hypothetical protein
MRTCIVQYHKEEDRWFSETEAHFNTTLEDDSVENLINRVCLAAPEIYEMNTGYAGKIKFIFKIKGRKDIVKVSQVSHENS